MCPILSDGEKTARLLQLLIFTDVHFILHPLSAFSLPLSHLSLSVSLVFVSLRELQEGDHRTLGVAGTESSADSLNL